MCFSSLLMGTRIRMIGHLVCTAGVVLVNVGALRLISSDEKVPKIPTGSDYALGIYQAYGPFNYSNQFSILGGSNLSWNSLPYIPYRPSSSTAAIPSIAVTSTLSTPTSRIAAFAGGSLLTGSCAVPTFTSITNPNILYPWLGCSINKPECCAFPIPSNLSENDIPPNFGLLAKCPADYTTTSKACCPLYVLDSIIGIFHAVLCTEKPAEVGPSTPLF
jgi:hypothetical protein